MSDLIKLFEQKLESTELASYDSLLSHLDSCISVLENENSSYRPLSSDEKAGGLLDFSRLQENQPVIVVPDLHGRGKFLLDILNFRFTDNNFPSHAGKSDFLNVNNKTVLECLEEGLVYVVCLGDIFHSESRGRDRWIMAFEEYGRGNRINSFIKAEMKENLCLLEMLLILKSAFASHFHILKGNHENVLNEMNVKGFGNVPFRKFCDEGNMVADFLQSWYDDLILHEISCFERSLPVCAVFKNLVLSHAEPLKVYDRKEIINYHDESSDVVFGLTWTANDKAQENSVTKTVKALKAGKKSLWIAGHRPVLGKFSQRQDGKFIQIHNPEEENIAVAFPESLFDLKNDIISVEV